MKHRGNVFITGATSGIGEACARHLSRLGYRVFGAARTAPSVSDLREKSGERAYVRTSDAHGGDRTTGVVQTSAAETGTDSLPYTVFAMDVRDDESVEDGMAFLADYAGEIDVLINNAGIAVAGPAEELTTDEVRDQIETNFLGMFRVCRGILPLMRKNKRGLIINISSIAGLMGIPFQSIYSATKYAIEGFSESLQIEVAPFGVRVAVVEPGDTRTSFTVNRKDTIGSNEQSEYSSRFRTAITNQAASESKGWAAARVARTVARIVKARHPRFRYKPAPLLQLISPYVRRVIPDRLYLRIVGMFFGI